MAAGGATIQPTRRREGDLGEAVQVNDKVCVIEMLERRNADVAGMQARVDMVLGDGNLVAGGEFENAAA